MVRSENNRYEAARIDNICKNYFGVNLGVTEIILDSAPSSQNSNTTLFKTANGTIYALCLSEKHLTLADVKVIIRQMGIQADSFLPPNADPDYFNRHGQRIFKSVFPAHRDGNADDISFYKTLAPYSPALVKVSKINGLVRKYNTNWRQWQAALELSYQPAGLN